MNPTDVVVRPGQTVGYAIRGYPTRLLTITNCGNKLHFQEYDGAIGLISGKYLEEKLIHANPRMPSGPLDVRFMDNSQRLRVCTPQSAETTGVHIDIFESTFHLMGGAAIIGAIAGNELEARLEPEVEEIRP